MTQTLAGRRRRRKLIARLKEAPVKATLVIVGAAAVVMALMLVSNPWVYRIGGRFSPGMNWHGFGEFGRGAQAYDLYLDLSYSPGGASSDGTADLTGTAFVCRDKISGDPWDARLEMESTWLNTNGRKVKLHLGRPQYPNGIQHYESLDFHGVWQNPDLVLEDEPHTRAVVSYADAHQFESTCRAR